MTTQRLVCVLVLALLGGCATGYTKVEPGIVAYADFQVETSQAWNLAPRVAVPSSRKESRVWTQDGLLLDRLMIIPGVGEGETIFKLASKEQALPVFNAKMLPNEIEQLLTMIRFDQREKLDDLPTY